MGARKYQEDGDPRTSGPGFRLTVHPETLEIPLRWRTPRLVFVNSMSDLFHARVESAFVARVWAVMAQTPQHTYQVLTKRPERLLRVLTAVQAELELPQWPLPNVWLGTSVESDERVRRADHLRAAPARTRFLSLEPLLGPLPSLDLSGIDWIIVGGESARDDGQRIPIGSETSAIGPWNTRSRSSSSSGVDTRPRRAAASWTGGHGANSRNALLAGLTAKPWLAKCDAWATFRVTR